MTLPSGTRVGPYEILAAIGAGGMGEVYRARDPKLARDVAIKVLPSSLVSDPDRIARFDREARVLASLSHPHIGAIYGFEHSGDVRGLVLELIEGPTLADRLKGGPLPIAEALNLARQIAEALDAAHEKGIVHRDLKPANIKIAPNGMVKVLDFGLAKIDDDAAPDLSHSPTITVRGTGEGIILGTAAYMSPEQARGKPLDKRTDIWSFGCVLYEMLTGRVAFAGDTVSDSIAAILGQEPDWTALPVRTPPIIQRLLRRCFEKDSRQRLRDIGDVRHDIDHALAELRGPATGGPNADWTSATRARSRRWPIVATGLTLLILIGAGSLFVFRQMNRASSVSEPTVQLTDFNDSALAPALSADGRMLTFIRGGSFADSALLGQVYVQLLPKGAPFQLTRDQFKKEQPVFSPDGSRVIYTAVMPGTKLETGFRWDSWQVPVLGGTPKPFLPNASGLVWADDQRLLYSEMMSGIHMGIVTSTESRTGSRAIYFPQGENGMAHRSARSPDAKSLLLVEMNGGDWLPCRLMPFDGSSTGRAVGPQDGQCTTTAWSPDGRWMYFSSNAGGRGFHIWRQEYPDGKPEQITFGPTEQEGTALTPDGRHMVTSMGLQQASIWMKEPGGERQLTSQGFTMLPTMMPAGDRVFYLMRTGARGYASGELYSMNAATGESEPAVPGRVMANYSISHDGRHVVFTSSESQSGDGVWIADLDRRSPPRQLTHGGEFRAFFGAPGEIVYMDEAPVRHLYRMREDGSSVEMISPDSVSNLIAVSPDGRWAVALVPATESGGGTRTKFISLRGERSILVCCSIGFGPNRVQAPLYNWSRDGKVMFVALQYFGKNTAKTVVLPYRSDVPLETLWPAGLQSESDVAANPGAKTINEANAFPASTASAYLSWRRVTQSNLYRVPLPN
jgi:serine/threonine protein kinase/Tol biopolymer transport system component